MTVTIRIQYKGEGARKLLAEEHSQDRDASRRYVHDMNRALSMFSIPNPPDSSRVIWKSGFVLCNYNTTKDTSFFDRIYRGVFRAQSIACRATLDGLHISYIHLFENSKPVFFGKQSPIDETTILPPRSNYTSRPRSPSPQHRSHYTRRLGPERTAPELSRQATLTENPQNDYRSQSLEAKAIVKSEPTESSIPHGPTPNVRSTATNGITAAPGISEALKKLAESHTLLSILGQSQPATPVPVKVETPLESSGAPRPLLSSVSDDKYGLPRRLASPPPRSNGAGNHEGDDRSSRPRPLDDRYSSNSRSFNNQSNHRVPSPSPRRGRSTSPTKDRRMQYEPLSRHTGHRASPDRETGHYHKKWYNRSRSPYHKRSYDDKLETPSSWSKGPLKRPLSPIRTSGRAGSPPPKRRYSGNDPRQGSPMQVDNAITRPSTSSTDYGRANIDQAISQPAPPHAPMPTAIPSGVNGTAAQHLTESQQVTALKRELWDVRRQITAMKARQDSILSDLKTLGAAEPAEAPGSPARAPLPGDKLKLLEAEITSLRSRLQSETVRRQLVEEACENERRRRKHAEDLLDDARRESNAPLVVPAMMDAFERIAQLTGEALISASEQEPPAATAW